MIKTFTKLFFVFILLTSECVLAQDTIHVSPFSFSGYVDVYAAYYTDSVGINNYQKYATISPRSEQMGLNVAMFTAKYSTDNLRSTVTLHYGDIPRSSWSSGYNIIQEANAGIRICKKWWLDAGFFRTHVGTEALFPKENYTSTVAVPTYFEPYYQAGIRLSYSPTDQLTICLHVLNGYNIFEDNNQKKSGGLLVTYAFSDHLNIGYSDYFGDDTPDTDPVTHLRSFHNVFINYKSEKFKITAGSDFAMQEHSKIADSQKSAFAWGALLVAKYAVTQKVNVYARGEVFNDDDGFLSGVFVDNDNSLTGLKIYGGTLGVEYKPTSNSYLRLESRYLAADKAQEIFYKDNDSKNNRMEVMINLGLWFE